MWKRMKSLPVVREDPKASKRKMISSMIYAFLGWNSILIIFYNTLKDSSKDASSHGLVLKPAITAKHTRKITFDGFRMTQNCTIINEDQSVTDIDVNVLKSK